MPRRSDTQARKAKYRRIRINKMRRDNKRARQMKKGHTDEQG